VLEQKGGAGMKIRYLGHASFELVLSDGRKIVFDPYESGAYDGALAYSPITGEFDVAVVSHDHADHRDRTVVSRSRNVVEGEGSYDFDGVKVKSITTYHDDSKGAERGKNLVSIVEADGLKVAHLGDLGHMLADREAGELKGVDIILIPVGGYFTIDAKTAKQVVDALQPKMVIPMHFKTPKVNFPIAGVEDFTALFTDVERTGVSEIEVTPDAMPSTLKVVVLEPSK